MHVPGDRPPGKKVNSFLAQLPCAGSGQDKFTIPVFNKPVHLIEQIRDTLNFVDYNPIAKVRWDQIFQSSRGSQ
jgi:hypothetical protein